MMLSSSANPVPNDGVLGVGFAESVFSRDECRQILELHRRFDEPQGALGAWDSPGTALKESHTTRLPLDMATRWIYERFDAAVGSANRGYQFDLSGFEPFQVATYAVGGYYDWHMDISKGPGSTRKLGITLQLSESGDYDGGDLEFRGGGAPPVAPREIGTLIVFPAYMQHRVTSLTRGSRTALVAWVHGTPFR